MTRSIRVASLNLRAYPNPRRSQIDRLAALIDSHRPDIALFQECKRAWLTVIEESTGLIGVHSHLVGPETPRRAFPPDGCAIAVRPPIKIESARRVEPGLFTSEAVREIQDGLPVGFRPVPDRLTYRYSARALLAEASVDGRTFVVGSFHATPGTGKVGGALVSPWKPFFHGGVALQLEQLDLPFLFAIDANEPRSETPDGVRFHTEEGQPGAAKFDALLGLIPIHPARDLLRESLMVNNTAPISADYLVLTYTTRGGHGRRFDSMWATKEFALRSMATYYEDARDAGTDHALIVADLEF